jgi:monovalent cation:H+ antiporter-2, CPA2 family
MEPTLLVFAIIIISATIMTYIFTKLKQPSVLAFILTGIIIGPMVLGLVTNTEDIKILSEIGIAFLLFSIGLGTDIKELKKLKLPIILLPILNVVFTFLVFLAIGPLLQIDFIQTLYVAFILSFSSTMLVAKILLDKFEINSLEGKIAIGILLVEDFVAVLAIPILKNAGAITFSIVLGVLLKTAAMVILAIFLNKIFYPYVIKNAYKSEQSFFLLSVASCFLFIFLSDLMDFPIAAGAFFGGLAVSVYPYNFEISSKISSIRDFLVTIIFVSLGMQMSFDFSSNLLLLVLLLVFVFLIKPTVYFFTVLVSGYGTKVSTTVGIYLAQISEFSLILAMQGIALGHLTNSQYSAIIIATSLSMLITPYFMKYHHQIYGFLKPLVSRLDKNAKFRKNIDELNNVPKDIENHVIIVGSDVVSDGIIKFLGKEVYNPIILVDFNPDKIKKVNTKVNYICGDINYEEVINSINIKKAKLAVITVPKFKTTAQFIKQAKKQNPKLIIYVRAHTNEEAYKLYLLGADLVILPHVLESNYLLDKVYSLLKEGPDDSKALRSQYLNYLKKELQH